jgi:hypothetical protein
MERSPLTLVDTGVGTETPAAGSLAPTETSPAAQQSDPELVMTSCANCGARMLDSKCKLICACGYFLSCSDYY